MFMGVRLCERQWHCLDQSQLWIHFLAGLIIIIAIIVIISVIIMVIIIIIIPVIMVRIIVIPMIGISMTNLLTIFITLQSSC